MRGRLAVLLRRVADRLAPAPVERARVGLMLSQRVPATVTPIRTDRDGYPLPRFPHWKARP